MLRDAGHLRGWKRGNAQQARWLWSKCNVLSLADDPDRLFDLLASIRARGSLHAGTDISTTSTGGQAAAAAVRTQGAAAAVLSAGGTDMAKRKAWVATWTEATGKRRAVRCPDRSSRDTLQQRMRARARCIKLGLARKEDYDAIDRQHTPIGDVAESWESSLLAKGTSGAHARNQRRAVDRCADVAGVLHIGGAAGLSEGCRDCGRAGSARTHRHYVSACKAFTRWASWNGWLAYDPLSHMETPRDPGGVKPRATFTVAEFERLRSSRRWRDYLLVVRTGLRWAEASKLRMSDVSLADGVLIVPKGVGKTDANRKSIVPLADDVLEALRSRMQIGDKPLLEWSPHSSTRFRAEIAKFGVTREKLYPASMRPTFTTWMTAAGVRLDITERIRRDSRSLAETRYVDKGQLVEQMRCAVNEMMAWYYEAKGMVRDVTG